MFAPLSLALAMTGFGMQPIERCPVTAGDHGLIWHQIAQGPASPAQVSWTMTYRNRSMREAVVAMHDVRARPATYQQMIDHVCASWAIFRGHHIVALNSYAVRQSDNRVVVQAIDRRGTIVLEPRDTVWPPGTVFIMVYDRVPQQPPIPADMTMG